MIAPISSTLPEPYPFQSWIPCLVPLDLDGTLWLSQTIDLKGCSVTFKGRSSRYHALLLLFFRHLFLESSPCTVGTLKPSVEMPQGEEVRAPAHSWSRAPRQQPVLTSHVSGPSWKSISQPQLSFPSQHPLDQRRATPAELGSNCSSGRKINDCDCFKPLGFRIICYAAVCNGGIQHRISEISQTFDKYL